MSNKEIMKAALLTPAFGGRWGLPLLFEGESGTGKSSIIKQVANELGLHVEQILPSTKDPTDISGLPIVTEAGSLRYAPPAWAESLSKAQGGLLFIDELTTCSPAVQAALLGVVLDGVVGDHVLPPSVRILSACNAVDDAADGNPLAPPMANRFCHIAWKQPSADDWGTYMLESVSKFSGSTSSVSKDLAAEEARVLKLWPEAMSKASAYVTSFVTKQPQLLQFKPASDSPEISKAWPSARTWEFATRALASSYVHGLSTKDTQTLVAGFVGVPAASQFLTWLQQADLPDPKELLQGKAVWSVQKSRLDITQAVLQSVTYLAITDRPTYSKYTNNLINLFHEVAETKSGTDILVRFLRNLFASGIIGPQSKLDKDTKANLSKLYEILGMFVDAAGITAKKGK